MMIPNRKPKPVKVKPAQTKGSRIERTGPIIRPGHRFYKPPVKVEPRAIGMKVEEPPRPPRAVSVPPIWQGETCFIIGGGPSLTGLDWNLLGGKKTIAINKAFLSHPNADVLYWTDNRFYSWHKTEIDLFAGQKYTIRHNHNHGPGIKLLNRGMRFGLETRSDTIAHGNNSGYAAINLAYHFGVKRIILLGYDMANVGGKSHFHDGYPTRTTPDEVYQKQFIPGFKVLADGLKSKGIEIWNACPGSKLTVWPRISLAQGLNMR